MRGDAGAERPSTLLNSGRTATSATSSRYRHGKRISGAPPVKTHRLGPLFAAPGRRVAAPVETLMRPRAIGISVACFPRAPTDAFNRPAKRRPVGLTDRLRLVCQSPACNHATPAPLVLSVATGSAAVRSSPSISGPGGGHKRTPSTTSPPLPRCPRSPELRRPTGHPPSANFSGRCWPQSPDSAATFACRNAHRNPLPNRVPGVAVGRGRLVYLRHDRDAGAALISRSVRHTFRRTSAGIGSTTGVPHSICR